MTKREELISLALGAFNSKRTAKGADKMACALTAIEARLGIDLAAIAEGRVEMSREAYEAIGQLSPAADGKPHFQMQGVKAGLVVRQQVRNTR